MKRKKHKTGKRGWVIGTAVIGAIILIGGIAVWQLYPKVAPENGVTLPDTDTTFSVPAQVGQPAPQFTAVGVDGKPYTVTPGDGRAKALVFFMGFQ